MTKEHPSQICFNKEAVKTLGDKLFREWNIEDTGKSMQ
jgi:hypothetical protein